MRDLVIRLASMKLAEMRFYILIDDDGEIDDGKYTLKEIKKMVKNYSNSGLYDQKPSDHVKVNREFFVFNFYSPLLEEKYKITVDKPDSMSSQVFGKLMESLS